MGNTYLFIAYISSHEQIPWRKIAKAIVLDCRWKTTLFKIERMAFLVTKGENTFTELCLCSGALWKKFLNATNKIMLGHHLLLNQVYEKA